MTATRRIADAGFETLALALLCVALGALAVLIADVWSDGASRLSWQFLSSFPSRYPEQAGIRHALAGSIFVIALTGALATLLIERLHEHVTILTPSDARGCQLSLRLRRSPAEARKVHTALTAEGFACDWREPDVIRVAPVPLYNTFSDVWAFAQALGRALGARW